MKQADKKLLIKDLCGRIPYGVKFVIDNDQNNIRTLTGIDEAIPYEDWQMCAFARGISAIPIEDIKPYLFPMSSMTKAQKKKYYSLAADVTIKPGENSYFGIRIHCIKLGISDNPHEGVWDYVDVDALDWLHKNHFDYRGLIEKGLAIDATNLNIY